MGMIKKTYIILNYGYFFIRKCRLEGKRLNSEKQTSENLSWKWPYMSKTKGGPPSLGGSGAPLYIRTWAKFYFFLFYSTSATKYKKIWNSFIFAGCPLKKLKK